MAAMAHEMDAVFTSAAHGEIGAVSTVASHINLSYHHVRIPNILTMVQLTVSHPHHSASSSPPDRCCYTS